MVLLIDKLHTIFAAPCSVHLLSVNETHLDSDILDEEVAKPGYSILICNRYRRGGEVALYISDTIDYLPFDIVNNVNIEAASAKVVLGKSSAIISTLY